MFALHFIQVKAGISGPVYARLNPISDKFGQKGCVILRDSRKVLVRPFSL